MKQTDTGLSQTIKPHFRAYQIEPIGRALLDGLHLPLSAIWVLAVILYFGVLFFLHGATGIPRPTDLQDIFRHPFANFYPNLNAIVFDLIGNPVLLVLLLYFRKYIPDQFARLEQSGFIKPRSTASSLLTSAQPQSLIVIVMPVLVAVAGLASDLLLSSPTSVLDGYRLFLSFLGRYGLSAVLVQFLYVFVFLADYQFDFRLCINHPDECSGLAPFGRLAMSAYLYLFVFAMLQAIGILTGTAGFEKALQSAIGPGAQAYLWVFFPLATIWVFVQLIYEPHHALQACQKQYLEAASVASTQYHQQLMSSITETMEQAKAPLVKKAGYSFSEDWELLETLAKLVALVEEMHTWPIPKRTLQTVAILTNPLVPMLLPVIVDVIKGLAP